MNYGKRNLSRRKKSLSSKKRMKKKRVGVRFFKALIICILSRASPVYGIISVHQALLSVRKSTRQTDSNILAKNVENMKILFLTLFICAYLI